MRRFKLIAVCAATFSLFVSSPLLAQPPVERDREAPDARPPRSPVISALDQNGDGEISAEEIKNAAAALETLDRDGDGKLTEEELRPPRRRGPDQDALQDRRGRGRPGPGRGGPGGGDFVERIMSNDKNSDGKVTKDEVPDTMQRFFDRIDENGDGVIEKSEVERMAERFQSQDRPRRRRPNQGRGRPGGDEQGGNFVERIMSNDKDGDGKVTKDEAPESMQRFFDRIDENGDGVIEKSEVERMAERFQNYRPGQRGRRGEARPQRPQRPPLESNDEA